MSSQRIKAIVGLGNPAADYAPTRHNIGFWFLDRLADRKGLTFRREAKFHGELARLRQGQLDCWLLKPETYMNRSGRAVAAMANFYKLAPEEILVVHDEIDLPPGAIRLKSAGGHGGHNGLRDVGPALGSTAFGRLRLGVGHPGSKEQVVGYVLARPTAEEQLLLDDAIERAIEELPAIISGEWARAMNRLHTGTA